MVPALPALDAPVLLATIEKPAGTDPLAGGPAGCVGEQPLPQEWHYTLGGQQMPTPVPAAELKRLATTGQLQPTDMVWRDGMANWVTAASLKDLFPPAKPAEGSSDLLPPPVPRKEHDRPERKPSRTLADLHPLLVLLLTLFTLGLFGLYYCFRTCLDFSTRGRQRRTDGAGRPLGRLRHPFWVLLLTYLSLGLYFPYWVYRVLLECSAYSARADVNARNELSLMLLFPPYTIYLAVCRLPEVVRGTQALAGVPETVAVTPGYFFLNPLMLLAIPFLALAYQDALNQVWLSAPQETPRAG
jgi:hypothetical protein